MSFIPALLMAELPNMRSSLFCKTHRKHIATRHVEIIHVK